MMMIEKVNNRRQCSESCHFILSFCHKSQIYFGFSGLNENINLINKWWFGSMNEKHKIEYVLEMKGARFDVD